ncbi:MAG: hypothetical protein AAGA23_02010 [Pseudomonadota bacterium]
MDPEELASKRYDWIKPQPAGMTIVIVCALVLAWVLERKGLELLLLVVAGLVTGCHVYLSPTFFAEPPDKLARENDLLDYSRFLQFVAVLLGALWVVTTFVF